MSSSSTAAIADHCVNGTLSHTVYEHSATSPILQKALHQTLPNSIALVYRTQHSNRTPHAHILATFCQDAQEIPRCWAAAYYDRSMRPETELWIFAMGEIDGHHETQDTEFCPDCRTAVLAIMDYLSTLPVPPLHPDNLPALEMAKQHAKEFPEPDADGFYLNTPGMYMRHLLEPSVVTLGACHHQIVKILDEEWLVRLEFPGRRSGLNKFIFNIADLPETRELPEGLRWGEMREKDIAIVKARTSIPRATRTLLSMKSVGVFDEHDTPVAWTFFGLDGSLTTLHVEPKVRGKGIAKAVAAYMLREYAPGQAMDGSGTVWGHADVYEGNVQSEGVCKSLGGRVAWQLFWLRIDLGRAGQLVPVE